MMIYSILVAVFSTMTFLHFLGLYLLKVTKDILPNQRLLMVNLAITEMSCSFWITIRYSVQLNQGEWNKGWEIVDLFVLCVCYVSLRFIMLHMVWDRFLKVHLNIKYAIYINSKKLLAVIVMLWVISATFALLFVILQEFVYGRKTTLCIIILTLITLDLLIVISIMITYTYFHQMVAKFSSQQAASPVYMQRTFRVPCFIVITYVIFNITSNVLSAMAFFKVFSSKVNRILNTGTFLLLVPAYLSDVCIYVFFQKEIRGTLLMMIRRKKRTAIATVSGTL